MDEDEYEIISKKQELLQKEIVDKNYDKAAFVDFCLSKKDNLDDFNNFTLEELIIVVNEFQSYIKEENKYP